MCEVLAASYLRVRALCGQQPALCAVVRHVSKATMHVV